MCDLDDQKISAPSFLFGGKSANAQKIPILCYFYTVWQSCGVYGWLTDHLMHKYSKYMVLWEKNPSENSWYDCNWRNCTPQISYFCVDLHYCCLKYAKISTSFPSLDQAIFWNLMLRLLQMAFPRVYISKIFWGGACPWTSPRMSHAFGARLHDHSNNAGFSTVYSRWSHK
jgi:hypothetical protein